MTTTAVPSPISAFRNPSTSVVDCFVSALEESWSTNALHCLTSNPIGKSILSGSANPGFHLTLARYCLCVLPNSICRTNRLVSLLVFPQQTRPETTLSNRCAGSKGVEERLSSLCNSAGDTAVVFDDSSSAAAYKPTNELRTRFPLGLHKTSTPGGLFATT